MNREQFDHAIRAAAGVLGVEEVIVIGSQAVHATLTALFTRGAAIYRGRHRAARRSR